jgi:transcriptional regulator with GAF, ATPase, and Fis domain
LRELQTLQQLSHALSGTLQVDEIIDSFFQGCTKLLGFDFVILSLVDKNHQRIRAIAGLNVTDAHIERANHPLDSDNIMADIIRTGHTEIISGWDERFDMDNFDAEGMANWGMRVFTPITLQQENIGVVEVGFNKEVEVTVQDSQIRLVRILIDQTALALDNAQRYQASQRTAHREQTIREITENMQAAPNLEVLVKTAAEELGSRLSAAHVVVELGLESSLEEDIVNQPPQNGANA